MYDINCTFSSFFKKNKKKKKKERNLAFMRMCKCMCLFTCICLVNYICFSNHLNEIKKELWLELKMCYSFNIVSLRLCDFSSLFVFCFFWHSCGRHEKSTLISNKCLVVFFLLHTSYRNFVYVCNLNETEHKVSVCVCVRERMRDLN